MTTNIIHMAWKVKMSWLPLVLAICKKWLLLGWILLSLLAIFCNCTNRIFNYKLQQMINHLNQNIFASKIAINMAKKLTKIIKLKWLLLGWILLSLLATHWQAEESTNCVAILEWQNYNACNQSQLPQCFYIFSNFHLKIRNYISRKYTFACNSCHNKIR